MVLDLRNFDERENPRSIERNALPCWGEGSANGANSAFLPVDQRVPDRFSPYQTQSSGIGFEKTSGSSDIAKPTKQLHPCASPQKQGPAV
jgi:hypothetical protein